VDVDLHDTSFSCTDGKCPDGYACVMQKCVIGGDGGSTAADATAIDATPGEPDADPHETACDQMYGTATGYVFCGSEPTADATVCSFYVRTEGGTCTTECGNLGGTCTDAFDADNPDYCVRTTNDGCDATHTDQICLCTPA
jgi:hypothetical protein